MLAIDLAGLRTEIEAEREWREAEVRLLRNQLALLPSEETRQIARKAIVVMLYAHFEGLCRALFTMYLSRVSALGLRVVDAAPALSATCLTDVFEALRDPQRKCRAFARQLPDDAALHRHARDREFVEVAWQIGERVLRLEVEKVVDAESNLKPVVLKKMLYRAGLDPNLADPWEGKLHRLLNRRNDVAHGSARSGVKEEELAELEAAVAGIVDAIVRAIMEAVVREDFRKSA